MTTLQSNACQTNDPNNLFPMAIDSLRFPLDTAMRIVFTGHFNGFSVAVNSEDEMALLHQMGCFGKGSFSRSKPRTHQESLHIMRRRQFIKRNYWHKKFTSTMERSETDLFLSEAKELMLKIKNDSKKKDVIDLVSSDEEIDETDDVSVQEAYNSNREKDMVVIVPNSDSEDDDYFAKLKPKCCVNKTVIPEKLMLTLQEAFFLSYGLGCLQVVNEDRLLSIQQCWQLFLETDKNFIPKYVVYHYYRAKGYVVKPAIKFGGDYLIYKEGPEVAHADFIVVIRNLTEDWNWVSLLGHIRMANTTVKEIIVAEVEKHSEDVALPDGLNKYSVRELLFSRNIPMTINDDTD